MFTTLKKLCINEINEEYAEKQKEIETEDGFKRISSWYGKTYTKNSQIKLSKFLDKRKNKELEEIETKISSIETTPEFKENFVITLEWVRSSTWGLKPKVSTNTGFEYKGISGCGYDKQSTATAQALNSNLSILKLLYQKKEDALNSTQETDIKNGLNRKILGYGSGYSILPYFEGGVGVNSHEYILNSVGLNMDHISDTKTTDVYIVSKTSE